MSVWYDINDIDIGARLGDSRGNALSGSWRLTSSQFRATRQPYTTPIAAPPVAERVHSPAHTMRSLRHEYSKELAAKYPKQPFDHFESGDKIELVRMSHYYACRRVYHHNMILANHSRWICIYR